MLPLRPRIAIVTIAAALLAACAQQPDEQQVVNVYSSRQPELIQPLFDRFTDETGIRVNTIAAAPGALIERVRNEGENSPADLLLLTDVSNLQRAKDSNLLQPINDDATISAVPPHLQDSDHQWLALSVRARIIAYAPDRVDPATLADGYASLADPRFAGRICMRSSESAYNQSLLASFIAHDGEDAAAQWVEGVVTNFARPPKGGDRDQIRDIAAGVCDLSLVNTYYVGTMLADASDDEQDAAEAVALYFPSTGNGTHVNISGAGIPRFAPHRDNAIALLRFMTGDEAQQFYADSNYEYPVRNDIPRNSTLAGWGDFRADTLSLDQLAQYQPVAIRLFDRGGWQ